MIYCFFYIFMRIWYIVVENVVLDKIYDNIVFSERKNVFGMYDLGINYEGGMKVV